MLNLCFVQDMMLEERPIELKHIKIIPYFSCVCYYTGDRIKNKDASNFKRITLVENAPENISALCCFCRTTNRKEISSPLPIISKWWRITRDVYL